MGDPAGYAGKHQLRIRPLSSGHGGGGGTAAVYPSGCSGRRGAVFFAGLPVPAPDPRLLGEAIPFPDPQPNEKGEEDVILQVFP